DVIDQERDRLFLVDEQRHLGVGQRVRGDLPAAGLVVLDRRRGDGGDVDPVAAAGLALVRAVDRRDDDLAAGETRQKRGAPDLRNEVGDRHLWPPVLSWTLPPPTQGGRVSWFCR